ncbi:MAG: DUF1211 domain-containing protein [Streptosporangiales bacterium]|nr:DUF1211 domain-containing protein [Streptosporangiales bacterium]MBO0890959.1 DUF1211 domain-containing protein [Acidothermales bacterium]
MAVADERGRMVALHEPDRMVFFSDAVVAIAMTLLALELPVPHSDSARELVAQLDAHSAEYGAFVLSFFSVAGAWEGHHTLFAHVARIDATTIGRNVQWLFLVVMAPFVTKLVTSGGAGTVSLRLACYGVLMGLLSIALLRIYQHQRRRDLLDETGAHPLREWARRRAAVLALAVLSIPLAFVVWWAAVLCWVLGPLTLRWLGVWRAHRARRAGG